VRERDKKFYFFGFLVLPPCVFCTKWRNGDAFRQVSLGVRWHVLPASAGRYGSETFVMKLEGILDRMLKPTKAGRPKAKPKNET